MNRYSITYIVVILLCMHGPVGTAASLPQAGDFLTNPDCPRGTTGYPNAASDVRKRCRDSIKKRRYTHHYLSITSSIRNFFADPLTFKARLQELVNAGIQPVVFLTSDNGAWKNKSTSSIKTDLSKVIPMIDGLVSSYIMGIEIEEYWSVTKARDIGNHLQGLTSKRIADHQLAEKWNYCKYSWCDYMFLQYRGGHSTTSIKAVTRNVITDLRKPVVAGEYNAGPPESRSVALGNAAVSAGASGFGNGGTP